MAERNGGGALCPAPARIPALPASGNPVKFLTERTPDFRRWSRRLWEADEGVEGLAGVRRLEHPARVESPGRG